MTFVSYAQNYEDVMLARALAGVERGFYIDVGAQDPRFDSVTKAFYDRGWHGINLEPVEHWHRRLEEERPRDINLCLAAGDHEGSIEFHETDQSGLSTASAEFAERHRAQGYALRTRQVPVSTLDAICRAHDVREVHFLKVDVEGAEAEVLRGLDLGRLRPWIILVEATEPNSRVSTHARWESLVTDHGYRMAYQDGLNRYYLAREHENLAPAFASPPNIFDDFVRRELVDLESSLRDEMTTIEAESGRRAALVESLSTSIGRKDEQLAGLLDYQRLAEATLEERRLRVEQADAEVSRLHAEFARLAEHHQADLAALRALAAEHQALQGRWENAAARLDQAERSLGRLSRELLDAQSGRAMAQAQLRDALDAHGRTLAAMDELRADHQLVINSRSWRITAPLRSVNAWFARWRARRAARRQMQAPVAPATGAQPGPEPELPLSEDAEAILATHPVQPRSP